MQTVDNNSNGKDKKMKKTPNEATIESLYKDYKDRQQKATTEAGALKQILAEDDKRITALTDKVNASVSSMTEEEYIATCKALENEKLTKEMHEKQLKEKAGAGQGFATDAEKTAFISSVKKAYTEDEAEFCAECAKHIEAIDSLLKDRSGRMAMFTEIGGNLSIVLQASMERTFYASTIQRYYSMQKASKMAYGKK